LLVTTLEILQLRGASSPRPPTMALPLAGPRWGLPSPDPLWFCPIPNITEHARKTSGLAARGRVRTNEAHRH